MSSQRAKEAARGIVAALERLGPEGTNEPVLREISRLLDVVREEERTSTDVYMKVGELRDWLDVLASPEKHERFGGFARVRLLTRHSCEALEEVLDRL